MTGLAAQLRLLLITQMLVTVAQCCIFAWLLIVGVNGKLMQCLMPPCEDTRALWFALAVFAFIAVSTLRALIASVKAQPSNTVLMGTFGVAVAMLAIDVKFAHPIPHGGTSLNFLMYSDIATSEQALLPLVTVVLSVVIMGLNIMVHRALYDQCEMRRASKAR